MYQSKTEANSLRKWGSSSLALSSGSHCSSWSWGVEIFDLEKTFVSTDMLMRFVICTLYWALMPATVVGKNMVAQARVTNKPLKNRATELQPWCDDQLDLTWGWRAGVCSRWGVWSAWVWESPLGKLRCRTLSDPWERMSDREGSICGGPVVYELHAHLELRQGFLDVRVDDPVDSIHLGEDKEQ